ncbi:haloalkane dehalogenase [Streptomyces finlayi]|uniref:Haloalkane dehalogenase n=1 Tax=Streptomyces finlayi TaxID=67296 RepID=A0A7G7BDK8_9ACTN|nr:haloalkane dehalogenase [Streptomyces finlayi]QNE73423.1 haloalkane dehalogenase [Streptomyces finlayi]
MSPNPAGTPDTRTDRHPRKIVDADGVRMSYVDTGSGDRTVVFLHGNPTSSYMWRNVIANLAPTRRYLAPDLAGMGASGPTPDGTYRFGNHARHLDAWFDAVLPDRKVTLVMHEWGAALGLDWARRHADRVDGLAHMEGVVQGRRWADFPPGGDALFRAVRGDKGEEIVLDTNLFVEKMLPMGTLRALDEREMAAYRAPFPTRRSRVPTLTWARELPLDGEPQDVAAIVEANGTWASGSQVPKLLIAGEPGAVLTGAALAYVRSWPNQREVGVTGTHFLPEDSPQRIAEALQEFLDQL